MDRRGGGWQNRRHGKRVLKDDTNDFYPRCSQPPAHHGVARQELERAGISAVEIFCARQHLDYPNRSQIAELGHWFRDSD